MLRSTQTRRECRSELRKSPPHDALRQPCRPCTQPHWPTLNRTRTINRQHPFRPCLLCYSFFKGDGSTISNKDTSLESELHQETLENFYGTKFVIQDLTGFHPNSRINLVVTLMGAASGKA